MTTVTVWVLGNFRIGESMCCIPETNITLYINHNSIKKRDYVICKQQEFYFLLSDLMCVFFSYLIVLIRTFYTMLMSGDCRHLCLVHDLKGKCCSLSPLSMIFAIVLSYMALLYWGMFVPYKICWRSFSQKDIGKTNSTAY